MQSTKAEDPKAKPINIGGQCVVLPSGLNPMAGPCNSIVLILNDTQDKEIQKTRTDVNGIFQFSLDQSQKGPFRIASGTRFFEPTKPKAIVMPGQNIELELNQK